MKFLKGLALAILGFLLFLSLSIFGIVFMLNQTILNPDFVASQVDRLDIASLAKETIIQQMPQQPESVVKAVNDTIADLEPWLKQQTRDTIYSFYDYLEGRSQNLSLVVSLEPVKESLRKNLGQDEIYQQISQQIPSTFELSEASLGAKGMAQLEQVKQYIGYLHLAYNALIGLILLLILLIIVIHRQVRGSTRGLGTTFLSCGILSYAGALVAKNVAGTQLPQLNIPTYLQAWVPQLIADTLAPLEIYGIALLAVGVVLLVVSFVYKPRQPSP